MDISHVISGLETLSEYLSKHFDSKVFVLKDEHDSSVMQAVFTEELMDDFCKVVEFNNGSVSKVLESNEFVEHAFITGAFSVAGPGLSGPNNVEECKFVDR
jgi:hypothetical protein